MIRLSISCHPDQAEFVLAELVGIAPTGVEERTGDGRIEYAIYGAPGELPEIGEIEAVCAEGVVEVRASDVPSDWDSRWRDFHQPVIVPSGSGQEGVWVGAPWHDRPADPGAAVVIDPGRAFGTGSHPTTRLCLGLMLDLHDGGLAGGGLSDIGTGSGILAIVGSLLGWDPVSGSDHEVASVEAATANARANLATVDFTRHDLRDGFDSLEPTLTANLTAPLLATLSAGLPEGNLPLRIVCSGLLEEETGRVVGAFSGAGYRLAQKRSLEGWSGLLLELERD